MQHVDDGTIHAWLDEQITDPAEAARLDAHLRECAACRERVDSERALLDRAGDILASAEPVVERPSFHQLAARAGRAATDRPMSSTAPAPPRRPLVLALGWAASLAIAVTAGWLMRDATLDRDDPLDVERTLSSASVPADPNAEPPAAEGAGTDRPSGTSAAVTAPRGSSALSSTPPPSSPSTQTSEMAGARAVPQVRTQAPESPSADISALFPPEPAAIPPAQPGVQAPLAVATPAPLASAPADATAAAAAPAFDSSRVARVAPSAEVGGGVVGGTAGDAGTANVTAPQFRIVPRTQAAALSGMALYGLGTLAPVTTSISADNRIVRTVYRLPSGGDLELEQQRGPAVTPMELAQRTGGGRSFVGSPPVAADVIAIPRVWSGTRGDVRLMLRTASGGADLDALGAALRVE